MVNQNELHFFSERYACISAFLSSSEQSERCKTRTHPYHSLAFVYLTFITTTAKGLS